MTRGQQALTRLIASGHADRRHIDRKTVARIGLEKEFDIARRAGLIQSAGYECSVAGDDWLDSPAGRSALNKEQG